MRGASLKAIQELLGHESGSARQYTAEPPRAWEGPAQRQPDGNGEWASWPTVRHACPPPHELVAKGHSRAEWYRPFPSLFHCVPGSSRYGRARLPRPARRRSRRLGATAAGATPARALRLLAPAERSEALRMAQGSAWVRAQWPPPTNLSPETIRAAAQAHLPQVASGGCRRAHLRNAHDVPRHAGEAGPLRHSWRLGLGWCRSLEPGSVPGRKLRAHPPPPMACLP